MHTDTQVISSAVTAAPSDYLVPLNAELLLKCVNATFKDNGAAGDWLPCVTLISDSGHVIARAVDQNVKVTAGDDAEVSWFRGVKSSAAGFTSAFLAQSGLWQRRAAVQSIPSGVVTPIAFTTFTSAPGYLPGMFGTPAVVQNPVTFSDTGDVLMTLTVDFEAAGYDRYIELTIANPQDPNASVSPRIRESVSPDGDRLVLSADILGGSGPPATTVTANVFQASGVNRNVSAQWDMKAIPGRIFLI